MDFDFKAVAGEDQTLIYNIYKVISLEMDIENLNNLIQKERQKNANA